MTIDNRDYWDWLETAACRTVDSEVFFPIGSGKLYDAQVIRAQRVCSMCPVINRCRDFAIRLNVSDGVWAGELASEFAGAKFGDRHAKRVS